MEVVGSYVSEGHEAPSQGTSSTVGLVEHGRREGANGCAGGEFEEIEGTWFEVHLQALGVVTAYADRVVRTFERSR